MKLLADTITFFSLTPNNVANWMYFTAIFQIIVNNTGNMVVMVDMTHMEMEDMMRMVAIVDIAEDIRFINETKTHYWNQCTRCSDEII